MRMLLVLVPLHILLVSDYYGAALRALEQMPCPKTHVYAMLVIGVGADTTHRTYFITNIPEAVGYARLASKDLATAQTDAMIWF